ncbi:hypothetical protein BH24ACI5_BH24ACI5_10740 [soil metagenome]
MHVHYLQDEGFTVDDGRLGYQRQEEAGRYAGPGESVVFKAGEPHRFWNAGAGDLRCTGYVEPAGNVEFLLTEIFESSRRRGGGRPDLLDAAFLMTRCRGEFAMLEIPAPVQRFLFPILVMIGTLLGRYRKYADALRRARPWIARRGQNAQHREDR